MEAYSHGFLTHWCLIFLLHVKGWHKVEEVIDSDKCGDESQAADQQVHQVYCPHSDRSYSGCRQFKSCRGVELRRGPGPTDGMGPAPLPLQAVSPRPHLHLGWPARASMGSGCHQLDNHAVCGVYTNLRHHPAPTPFFIPTRIPACTSPSQLAAHVSQLFKTPTPFSAWGWA